MAEKTKKIEPYRHKYSEWWLVLVDHIGHAHLENQEISVLREHIAVPPEWSKLVLVNPSSPEMAVEI